ncbi:Mitochondrial fission 1 protein A [Vitis vinifera]|uniref:Mitochondrial fission 1 protein A n=1 Tax=Vitis vinifera TaxID=29760 RepID=A0A438I6E2_VITVI|nr:Mitochondrial fission 1 protein A [Vitis vinifera]
MEAKTGKFFESVGAFLDGGEDQIPWCDRDVIAGCEKEVADAANGGSEEHKSECIMRLSWALVHSRQAEDIQRGIAMLEVPYNQELSKPPVSRLRSSLLLSRAVKVYSIPKSRLLLLMFFLAPLCGLDELLMLQVRECSASLASSSSPLQKREKLYLLAVGYYRSGEYGKSRQLVIAPDFRQVLTLKKTVEDRIAKDGVTGKGITASAVVGLIAGGIAGGIAAALARKK